MFFEQDKNFKPKIYNYATEMSYDVKAYQIVETKAKAIDTIQRANELNIHSFEDISQNAITFAEMKAISSGNPLLLEQFKIENELKKIQKQEKLFLLNNCEIQNRVSDLKSQEIKSESQIESLEAIKLALAKYESIIKTDYSQLQNPLMMTFYEDRKNDLNFKLFSHSKDPNKEELKKAKTIFQKRIRDDIKQYRDNPTQYRAKNTNYFPVIMEYKGLSIIPKIEEYAVQFCLISKDDYRHGLHLGNFSYRKNYYEDTNSMIEPKSLRMSKDMFFNDIGFDYFTKRIDNFVKDIDKHLQEERQNHNKIVADKEQSKNLLEQNQGGFAKQELLNALKKDRDTIIEKIQNKEKDWIPSYKMLHQKNVEKEQELNYN